MAKLFQVFFGDVDIADAAVVTMALAVVIPLQHRLGSATRESRGHSATAFYHIFAPLGLVAQIAQDQSQSRP